MNIRLALVASAVLAMGACFGAPARAITVKLDFTANFPEGAPESTLTGEFTYQAASVTSPIDSLTSVDLTIAGYAYTLGEVDFDTEEAVETTEIGSTINGFGVVVPGTDSFSLTYNPNAGFPYNFVYATTSSSAQIDTGFPQFSVTAVPEPATWSLLLTGFLAAGGLAVRRRFG